MMRRRLLSCAFVVILALATLGAGNQSRRFEKLGHEIMCTCGCNQILLECNHVGCPVSGGMRNELSTAVASNDNPAILALFVAKYGPVVLAAPTKVGFDRVAWIIPFAVFLGGIVLVIAVVRNWKLRPAKLPAVVGSGAGSTEYLDALRARARQETDV